MKKLILPILVFIAGCTSLPPSKTISLSEAPEKPSLKVKVGLDVLLDERFDLIQGKSIGLVTNNTGVDMNGMPNYDRLIATNNIDLKVIFSPEHGLFGESAAGEKVTYKGKVKTLPRVVSLYGKNRKPTPDQLAGLDVILYDIQDVGARFYTYISTMGLVMEAAAESGIQMIILDRPNPITGVKVDGPILDMAHKSFVGHYPIPIRYGMTAGELARMINGEKWISSSPDIVVIPVKQWNRNQWQDEVNIPWIKPSPNIPDLETALIYPGMCLLEATNLSEGRGTQKPFKRFGAPWINKDALAKRLNEKNLSGVSFKAVSFIPTDIPGMAIDPKFENQVCHGIEIEVTNREIYKSVFTGVTVLRTIKELYPNQIEIKNSGMNRLWGKSDHHFADEVNSKGIREFIDRAKKYYLYE